MALRRNLKFLRSQFFLTHPVDNWKRQPLFLFLTSKYQTDKDIKHAFRMAVQLISCYLIYIR